MKVRAFVIDETSGKPLTNVIVNLLHASDRRVLRRLSTDFNGYVSFSLPVSSGDLLGLEVEGLASVQPESTADVANETFHHRRSRSAASAVIPVKGNHDDPLYIVSAASQHAVRAELESIKDPDYLDWKLSPRSFTTTPSSIHTSEDGPRIEDLPRVGMVRQIGFRAIVRRSSATEHDEVPVPRTYGNGALNPIDVLNASAPTSPRLVEILEYVQEWEELGASLGDIVHSLPLAPCETVQYALIEGSRTDVIARHDSVQLHDELTHGLFRDRTIEDTVGGLLSQQQSNWTLTGGAGVNLGLFRIGVGGEGGQAAGMRSLHASEAHDLHDQTIQATTMTRNLSSTVMVQGVQAERHNLVTRTITNHNQYFAMTMQFYTILRNVAIKTRLKRRQRGLYIPIKPLTFNTPKSTGVGPVDPVPSDLQLLDKLEVLLGDSLLRPELKSAFLSARRLLYSQRKLPSPVLEPDTSVNSINVRLKRGQYGTSAWSSAPSFSGVFIGVRKTDGTRVWFANTQGLIVEPEPLSWCNYSEPGLSGDASPGNLAWLSTKTLQLTSPVMRSEIDAIEVRWIPHSTFAGVSKFSLRGVEVQGISPNGAAIQLVNQEADASTNPLPESFVDLEGSSSTRVFDVRPLAPEAPLPSEAEIGRIKQVEEDRAAVNALTAHISDFGKYYATVSLRNSPSLDWNAMLEAAYGSHPPNYIDPNPVGFVDDGLVFRLDVKPSRLSAISEPLIEEKVTVVSFPTRGLFGEAELGRKNAREQRDPSRQRTVDEPRCTDIAPDIEGIMPGFKGQPADVKSEGLPTSVVQIAQPPAAPDPVGMAAILGLLGRGDVFAQPQRSADLVKLVNDLASGAVDLPKAKEIASKLQKEVLSDGHRSLSRQLPSQRYDNLQVAKQVASAAHELGWSTPTTEMVTSAMLLDDQSPLVQASWTSGNDPRPLLLKSGPAAAAEALRLLRSSGPVQFESANLVPGQLWSLDSRLLCSADSQLTWFLQGSELYVQRTSVFVRDHYIGSMAKGGAKTWITKWGKAETAILTGIFAGTASAIVSVIDMMIRLYLHRTKIPGAIESATAAAKAVLWLTKSHPDTLRSIGGTAWDDVLERLVSVPDSQSIGEWLGDIIGEVLRSGAQYIALSRLAAIVAKATASATVVHVAGMSGRAVTVAVNKEWQHLQSELANEGVEVTEADVKRSLRQLLTNDELRDQLAQLNTAIQHLMTFVEALRFAPKDAVEI